MPPRKLLKVANRIRAKRPGTAATTLSRMSSSSVPFLTYSLATSAGIIDSATRRNLEITDTITRVNEAGRTAWVKLETDF